VNAALNLNRKILGNCNIWSVTNYSVYFETKLIRIVTKYQIFDFSKQFFNTVNIYSKIKQIVPHFL
jgi:hypothetical protein